jgi:beta-phosphoglucomutase-like phosphatase (HAD superfamily)
MSSYRPIDDLAEERAREQQGRDEQLRISRVYDDPAIHRAVAAEYVKKSPAPDPWLRAQAFNDAIAPPEAPATLSTEGEADLEWLRAQDAARSERPRTAQDDALDELRQRHEDLKAQGIEDGWVDPSDPRNRFPQGGPR